MNTTLRYSAYVALLLGSTSIALADGGRGSDTIGSFTFGGGVFGYESTDEPTDTNDLVLNGAAAVHVRLAKEWSVQFDAVGEQVAAAHDGPDEQYQSSQAVGGHLTWRKPGTGNVGIFAGYGSGSNIYDYVSSGGWLGVEGQLFFNEITLYAQAAMLNVSDHSGDEGLNHSAYLVRAVGRYFWTDNCKVEFELARVDGDNSFGGYDAEGTEWALSVTGRLTDGPLYGTLGYRAGNYELVDEDDEADVSELTVAVTFLFGVESLKANDRDGVSLDTPMMATRATAIHDELY